MAAGLEGLARKRMEESPMPFFTNAQGLAGMDVGLSTGVSPFCVMRYNASAFFDQSNQEAKNASAHYMRKFWGQSIPPKELTELDGQLPFQELTAELTNADSLFDRSDETESEARPGNVPGRKETV